MEADDHCTDLSIRKKIVRILLIIGAYQFQTTAYKTYSNILLSRLTPYSEEITGDHQCGF